MSSPNDPASIKRPADLLQRLGGIPLERIQLQPPPGTATERDLLVAAKRDSRLCELLDGVLAETATGYRESVLAVAIGAVLGNFIAPRKLGLVSGAGGALRLLPGLVRRPAVALVSWQRVPGGKVPKEPVPDLVPDLAVEVLSQGNTDAEMERKRGEYFAAGVRLLWIVDPDRRTVVVSTGLDRARTLTEAETLDGGEVLPGFSLPLRELFAELDQSAPSPRG